MCNACCYIYQAHIQDDWNSIQKAGYCVGKREQSNMRIAQWKVGKKKFEGGTFTTITKGSEYHDVGHLTDMVTWNVLCALHGEQATIYICSVFV